LIKFPLGAKTIESYGKDSGGTPSNELSNRYQSYSPSLKLRRGRPCLIRKVLDVGAIMDTGRQEDYEKCLKDFREPLTIFRQGEECENRLKSPKGKHIYPKEVSSDSKRNSRSIIDAASPKKVEKSLSDAKAQRLFKNYREFPNTQ